MCRVLLPIRRKKKNKKKNIRECAWFTEAGSGEFQELRGEADREEKN
jgi:hypothetical protein